MTAALIAAAVAIAVSLALIVWSCVDPHRYIEDPPPEEERDYADLR